MAWNQDASVRSPVGRPFAQQLESGVRRQRLPGFDEDYRDIVHYIIGCTYRIWEQKNVGLCRTHYGEDCVLHTLAGPMTGVESVVQSTIDAHSRYPDRCVIGEDVIWSEEAPGVFYSSHRIISGATHMGDDPASTRATMSHSGVTTVADCLVRENRIVEEWLVRDNVRALWQVGADPHTVAQCAAQSDQLGDPARHAWRRQAIEAVQAGGGSLPPADHPAALPAAMLDLALRRDLYGEAARKLSSACEIRWPANRHGFGRGYWVGCLTQIKASLQQASWRLEHWAARPLPNEDIAVALRWSLTGHHTGSGVWGNASGRKLLLMAVSHYRLRGGVIVEDITVFDEVAVIRQTYGGLGA